MNVDGRCHNLVVSKHKYALYLGGRGPDALFLVAVFLVEIAGRVQAITHHVRDCATG